MVWKVQVCSDGYTQSKEKLLEAVFNMWSNLGYRMRTKGDWFISIDSSQLQAICCHSRVSPS
jgi:hypothetical protein